MRNSAFSIRQTCVNSVTKKFPNEEITWAGEDPWTGGFCVGTESGKILFPSASQHSADVRLAAEAVNGVAFWKESVGVSTRSQVHIYRSDHTRGGVQLVARIRAGAFGIVAT